MSNTKLKVALLGDGSVGQSCLTVQFTQRSFMKHYDQTIENAYSQLVVVDGENIDLEIIDTAGQEEYKVMRAQYIRSAQGFLLVYSVTSRTSLEILQEIWQQIIDNKRKENSSVVLVGNKCDMNDEREVSKEEGEALARKIGCFFFEASAKAGTNVDEAFTTLIRETKQKIEKATEAATIVRENGEKKRGGSVRRPVRALTEPEPSGFKLFRSESLRNIKEKMRRNKANTVVHNADDHADEEEEEQDEKAPTKKTTKKPARTKSWLNKDSVSKENGKHEDRGGGKDRCTIS